MQPHDFEGRGHNRAQNPYSDRFAVADMAGQPMLATVLRVEDIDRMVALRLLEAQREADKAQREACATAWEQGHLAGTNLGLELAAKEIDGIIRGRLNHVVRRLTERKSATKTTIAAEREFGAKQAVDVDQAVTALRGIGN